ncbi:hypothetical protein DPMN_143867 [Dreissena polymorpha]|uniref:Uncharacterized protein n=1 Tax=Dreissena polymorpha TaxID=45954 RepID=A0A9D4JKE9_DREPO|nr:hypothetical protein DPMN_143867 [Dreissena polymorpha]
MTSNVVTKFVTSLDRFRHITPESKPFFKHGNINMSNLEETLNRFIESVDYRLDEITRKFESRHSAEVRNLDGVNVPPNAGNVGTRIPPHPPSAARLGQSDLQGNFQALRDTLNVLSKCGRYCETGIQLLCTLEAGTDLIKRRWTVCSYIRWSE